MADAVRRGVRAARAARGPGDSGGTRDLDEVPEIELIALARSLASSGSHARVLPVDDLRPIEGLRIGYVGNMANNNHIYARLLRRLGFDAELVVEDGFFDAYLMNRPFWEELPVEADSEDQALESERLWPQPAYVRRVAYAPELQARFQGRRSAGLEVQAMYEAAFGEAIAPDRALVLAQYMGHWPLIRSLGRYDVVQVSGAPIGIASFVPRPVVVFPTGGDLFLSPFEETLMGLTIRAGYTSARHVIYAGSNYDGYLARLRIGCPRHYAPALMDTEVYCPGDGLAVRRRWEERSQGSRFLFAACRQNWQWKRNDILVRGFARFIRDSGDASWRLVAQSWGPDVERTRRLVTDLGIEDRVLWEKLCSRPVLRDRQRAADLVADQFAMEGYGTSVLEAMCAGKPVLIRYEPGEMDDYTSSPPPFLSASNEAEIAARLASGSDLEAVGRASRKWVLEHHGFGANLQKGYLDTLLALARQSGRGR